MKDNKKNHTNQKERREGSQTPLCKGGSGAAGGRLSGREGFWAFGVRATTFTFALNHKKKQPTQL